MSTSWKDECQCRHTMNYHRNIGKGSCTYGEYSVGSCSCGKFRSCSVGNEFKENPQDTHRSGIHSGGE